MTFKLWIQRTGIALLAAFAIGNVAAQGGRDVTPLNPPQPVENDGKIEVLEFFAYGCIHCANLEPRLAEWIARLPADVRFKRVPAAFAVRGIDSAPIFFTLEALGMQEKLHQKLFDAANLENVMLGNPATLNKWLEKQGVDPKKYEEMQRSFSVQNKINRAKRMSNDYKLPGTPALAVNGRFLVEQVAGADRLFANVDQLIADARAANKAATVAAKPAVTVAPAKK
ncbi:MAG: thiol:disulfide interchange protein DsbA/DsbL [Betaproteobacteria bacterium]